MAAALAMAVTSACEPTSTTTTVRLDFDDVPAPDGSTVSTTSTGSSAATASVVGVDGGRATSAADRSGSSASAVRLPRFDGTSPAPRAVVRITPTGSGEALNPRTGPVRFGADFVLDATSASAGSSVDDGNNLVQRGLWDGASQLKLEVDGDRVVCRIKGRGGEVSITGGTSVVPGTWYRTSCARSGSVVTLTVGRWRADSSYVASSWTKEGATGDLTPSVSSVPWSVGGKLRDDGTVHPATDQFNGRVDAVRIEIG